MRAPSAGVLAEDVVEDPFADSYGDESSDDGADISDTEFDRLYG